MHLQALPLSDDWAHRRMEIITRAQPPSQTPLGVLVGHLEGCGVAAARAV